MSTFVGISLNLLHVVQEAAAPQRPGASHEARQDPANVGSAHEFLYPEMKKSPYVLFLAVEFSRTIT